MRKINEKIETCEELFKQDHTTVDYMMKYIDKLRVAADKAEITTLQGMKFLEALYYNDHPIAGEVINKKKGR